MEHTTTTQWTTTKRAALALLALLLMLATTLLVTPATAIAQTSPSPSPVEEVALVGQIGLVAQPGSGTKTGGSVGGKGKAKAGAETMPATGGVLPSAALGAGALGAGALLVGGGLLIRRRSQ